MTAPPPTNLERLFPGDGEMARRMRLVDWASTPLGPVDGWPQSLRTTVGMLLASKAQILLIWGDDYVVLYNDAYAPVFGAKHPSALAKPVRDVVELHGGRVSVASDGAGRGATFSVRLPAALAEGTRVALAEPSVESLQLDGVEILLVEDDRDSLDAMTLSLAGSGATVRAATSVDEAWASFVGRAPDVVVSDLSMPEEDGYGLVERMRRAGSAVPAIALTGFTRPEDRARVLSSGFVAHVAKPIDPEHLVKVLVDVLAQPASAGLG